MNGACDGDMEQRHSLEFLRKLRGAKARHPFPNETTYRDCCHPYDVKCPSPVLCPASIQISYRTDVWYAEPR